MANERGQYGNGNRNGFSAGLNIGAELPSGRSAIPWILGVAAAIAGLAIVRGYSASKRSQLTAHEKEVRAWEAEFPGLPWYMDQVKSAEQLDSWERARDYWERRPAATARR